MIIYGSDSWSWICIFDTISYCSPQHYIPDMIKALKGVSARLLMKEFGEELKRKLWGGHLWNPSYFVATVSENTEEQIRRYIQSQKRK